MLGVILNETQIVNKFKKDYEIPKNVKITDIIIMLIRDYYLEGINNNEEEASIKVSIYEKVMKDIENTYKDDFIYTKWNDTIKNMVDRFYKNKRKYKTMLEKNDIDKIIVTKNELLKIRELNDSVLEKIAFVLLVYAKIYKIQMGNVGNDYWVNQTCNVICKEAKVGVSGDAQKLKLNQLYKMNYIDMSNLNNKTGIKINYIDEIQNENENGLTITDFDGVVYQYLIWKGERWKRCEVCGKWIRLKIVNSNKKYCNSCSVKVDNTNRNNRKR